MRVQPDITKRLLGYSAAGAAFALSAGTANAGIVFTNITDSFGPGDDAAIDFNGDATDEFVIFYTNSFSSALVYVRDNGQGFSHFKDSNGANGGGKDDPNALPLGFLIGPGGSFDSSTNRETLRNGFLNEGNFLAFVGEIRYLGVRFNLGGGDLYGWIAVRFASAGTGDVLGFAYEDTGAAIAAGDTGAPVPEPSSIALLAAGAAGLVALRRRRNAN